MPTWSITYEDGDEIVTVEASGKLSLSDSWVFALDVPTSIINTAIPCHRVVEVRLLDQ